jgi:tetratricopeptide (TPR) repeat protein
MRQLVVPILERHGVDLVLAGHSHSYERSMLLDGHYGLSSSLTPEMVLDAGDGNPAGDGAYEKGGLGPTPHDGAVYAVAGSSGGVGGGTYDHPVMVVSLAELGSLVLDFDASRLEARFLSSTGAVRDAFAIAKPAPGSLACSDGIDNDRDGERDFPADSGCKNALAPREDPPCHDGIDNDRDGLVDADDPYCLVSEREGPTCGLGFEIALAAPLLRRLAARRRGRGGGAGCRARGGGSSLGVMARPHATLALAAVLLLAALPGRAHEPLAEELAELDARADTASHVDLLLRRGELHRIRGETGLALADFEHARRLGAPAGEIERLRAHALLEAGRAAEARQAALAALEREPGSGDARLLEARALAALGRRGEAARAYDAALASLRDPGPDLYLERAALAAGPEPALAVVEAGLARLGPAASLELRAIELECALDRFDAALARLARLAERAPRRSPWLLRRAEILAAAGRGEEALRSLDEARRLAATERGGRPTPAETARALEVERAVGSSRTDASS